MIKNYVFTVSWNAGKSSQEIAANHPDEVWGEIWPNNYPPDDAHIVDVKDFHET